MAAKAAAKTIRTNGRIRRLSRGEGRKVFDRQARRHLRMSGAEFIRRWDAGEFKESDRPEVVQVAMLLPLGR